MKRGAAQGSSPPSPIFRSKRRPVRTEEQSAVRETPVRRSPPSPIIRSKRRSLRSEEKNSAEKVTAVSPHSPILQSKRRSLKENKSVERETSVRKSPPSPIIPSKRSSLEEKNSDEHVTAVSPPSPIIPSKRRYLEEKNSAEQVSGVSPSSPIFHSKRRSLEEKNSGVRVTAVSELSLCNTSGASGLQDSQRSYDFNEEDFARTKEKLDDVVRTAEEGSGTDGGGTNDGTKGATDGAGAVRRRVRSVRLSELEDPVLLSLGCPLLDSSLLGGLRPGELTEVVGESSAGKTQFSLQAAIQAAVRGETVIYIVTEGTFPTARLDQMVSARQVERARDNILVLQARNLPHLMAVLGEEVGRAVRDHPGVRLVVVDSVASLVRSEGELRSGLERGLAIHRLGQSLLQLSSSGLAVLAVNQVTARLGGSSGRDVWGRGLVASLGQVWDQYPHTRLWLSKTRYVVSRTASTQLQGLMAETRLRTINVDWSCRLPNTLTHFLVDTKGCHGVKIQS